MKFWRSTQKCSPGLASAVRSSEQIVNTLRAKGEHVNPGPTRNLSPDPDDNHICDCAEYGDADFIVTLNPKDFPQSSLRAKVIGPGDPVPGRRTTTRRSNS